MRLKNKKIIVGLLLVVYLVGCTRQVEKQQETIQEKPSEEKVLEVVQSEDSDVLKQTDLQDSSATLVKAQATNSSVDTKKNSVEDEVAQSKLSQDQVVQSKATQDKATQDKATQDKATQDKATQDKATQDKATQDKATQDKATQDKATQGKVAQSKATQDKAIQDKATQGKDTQDKVTQSKDTQGKATQDHQAQANGNKETVKKDEKKQQTVTLSISCSTILNNKKSLNPDKAELVPSDGVILSAEELSYKEGETVFDVLVRATKNHKIHMEYTGSNVYKTNYIEGINNLYEFDCGPLSGWMYKVNGVFPNYGCSNYVLEKGDVIEWVYTCDLGKDVGAGEVLQEGEKQ